MSLHAMTESPLLPIIQERIRRCGPLPVDEYMRTCLQHPKHGYYATKSRILGRTGDFITAPSVSAMFGNMIGMWCADMYDRLHNPSDVVLLEIGSGDGTCLQDVLQATRSLKDFHASVHVRTVDMNASLAESLHQRCADVLESCASFRQYQALSEAVDDITAMGFPIIIYANEWLDALPVRQFVRSSIGWHERNIAESKEKKLHFVYCPERTSIPDIFSQPLYQDALDATSFDMPILEYPEEALTAIDMLADMLAAHSGACLFIDYGYVRPPLTSTVQTLRHHHRTDIFECPGGDDITALVDFSLLQQRMSNIPGGIAFETVSQRDFLLHYGIRIRAAALKRGKDISACNDIDTALDRLIDPEHMGVLFKIGGCYVPQYT